MANNSPPRINLSQDLTQEQRRDVQKLQMRYDSLKSQNSNFSQQIWNVYTDLCRAKGEIGLEELNQEKKKLIEKDYQKKVEYYNQVIDELYKKYYDKINLLNNLKNTNNQQIEIINNSQYKILQQKNIQDKVLNESTTKSRLSLFYNKQFRFNLRSVHNTVYLTIAIFTILIIIFTINSENLKSNNFGDVIKNTLNTILNNKHLLLILICMVLFLIIIFKSYNLVILILIFYSAFVIFS